ncbi:MAG: prepilin-type N-terminal cleavage/methylation domain-containing protein [Bacillota bacterium]|nr:prepilin-type N-terminal cleavage/methylation domain-containing protein [Bacillota bacterium]
MLKKLWRRLNQEEQGFTLVELVVVIVILGVLAGLGIQQFGNIQETARQNANKANVRMLLNAARMYLMIDSPTSTSEEEVFTPGDPEADDPEAHMPYIAEWPEDPWGSSDEYSVEIGGGTGDAREVQIYLGNELKYPASNDE